ncbi:multidrug effflux MFS transporter [Aggregatibacter actinomycetemcomitans]|nr:multidrug effflux MFS transporter [Aggregatibacter actinomycetemcomitans]
MANKQNSKLFLVLLLGALSAFGPFILDLYLPALPQINQYFQSSTALTQVTLTSAMIGLSVGQLFLGPISDKYGRKKPLMISLAVYIVSSTLIVFSPNMESLIFLRTIQGLSSAGSVVISRAIATDLYRGREMARFFGLLMSVNGLAPIISPIIGSFLLQFVDWRGIFVALTLLGVFLMVAAILLKESLSEHDRLSGNILHTFAPFKRIAGNRTFMTFVALQSFQFASFFGYLASSAFIFQDFYGLTALQYSFCFAVNGTAMIVGVNLSNRLKSRSALDIGVFGLLTTVIFIGAMLLLQANVWLVECGFLVMLLCIGFVLPSSSTLAMESERQYAGSASALLGFCPFFLGGVASPLVGLGNIFVATSAVLVGFAALAAITYLTIRNKIAD